MKGNSYSRRYGENPDAGKLLDLIGMQREDFGRYRDAWLVDGGLTVRVMARIGGPFAAYYRALMDVLIAKQPRLNGHDDEFDETYYYIDIPAPADRPDTIAALYRVQGGEPETLKQRHDKLMHDAITMSREEIEKDPRFADDIAAVKRLMGTATGVLDTTDDDMPDEFRPEFLRRTRER